MIKNLFRHNEKKKKFLTILLQAYSSFSCNPYMVYILYNNNKYTLKISIQKLKLNDKINDDYMINKLLSYKLIAHQHNLIYLLYLCMFSYS